MAYRFACLGVRQIAQKRSPLQPGNKIKQCRRVRPDMKARGQLSGLHLNSHQSAFGYALMSPQPNRIMTSSLCLSMISGQTLRVYPEADHALLRGTALR